MKVSLAWVCEYLDVDLSSIDIVELVRRFNLTTAEIERYYEVRTSLDSLVLGCVTHINQDSVILRTEQHRATLPMRPDLNIDAWYLVQQDGATYRWALSTDLGSKKSMILPAIWAADDVRDGSWKKQFEVSDWILDIDNKSITNRPDLWGHYGIAREIAAMNNYHLIPFEQLLAQKDIKHGEDTLSDQNGFTITNDALKACSRFGGIYLEYIEPRPSLLWMATRLSRVDTRCTDAIVDMTNYVMLDMSQPLHAFDAHKIPHRSIMVCLADNKEKLELLDNQTIQLTSEDLIISTSSSPIALAGIMGGTTTAVTSKTRSVFLEAACFNATIIRQTAHRFGIRTEASARFEKSLDPGQNVLGIRRFLYLLHAAHIEVKESEVILSLGDKPAQKQIRISHEFIEHRLGASVSSEFVSATLNKLGFSIEHDNGLYTITIPDYRASKDIALKEDIVEEIGRFFGYDTIPYVFPKRQMRPFNIASVMRIRAIKELMAYGLHMNEFQPYAFFDQSFLKQISWDPTDAFSVQNPVSNNWKQLVTSLLPNLFKCITDHATTHEQLRFFEWGRIWSTKHPVRESKSLSGVVYEQKNPFSFYKGKSLLSELFALLEMEVVWVPVTETMQPWFDPAKTAVLKHNNQYIGIAGMTSMAFFEPLALGVAFIFEIDGDYLLSWNPPIAQYTTPSKFPSVYRDISLFIPPSLTVDTITHTINRVDQRIQHVELEDYFERKEWGDTKSITIRCTIVDPEKTLTKEEVDTIVIAIETRLTQLGGTVR